MRALGHELIDFLVEHLADPRASVPNRRATPEEMASLLGGPAPAGPQAFRPLLERLADDVLAYMSRCDHPRYLAFIPGSGTWPGALGDLIASAYNVYAGAWLESAGPSRLELTVLDWFKDWIGYPAGASGILVSGGSSANMTAMACAREALLGPMSDGVVAYVSDQGHSSIARAARTLGFRPDQVRVLPTDDRFRMRAEALEAAMDADREAGLQPLFVSASAGATNTGAIDPLPELADICRARSVWLHVDGAYGGFAVLTEGGRGALAGIELADSVTLDPHKWLYQPFECGCLLVRDGRLLRQAFEISPDYLKDIEPELREVNFGDLGLQLTRMSRAIKVWLSINAFGLDAFRTAIERCLDLAGAAARRISGSDRLELTAPPSLGIVCFRRTFPGWEEEAVAAANAALMEGLNASGRAFISSTRLRGRYSLRICVLNHSSTEQDVLGVLDWIERADVPAEAPATVGGVDGHDRHPPVAAGWLSAPAVEVATLRALPLFQGIDDDDLRRVAEWAKERTAGPGDVVVKQWDQSKEFFVLLDGSVEVRAGHRTVAIREPGDFFGELAALDWGAGFGYPRLASVVARSPVRLLTLTPGRFNELVRTIPKFGGRIRRAVRERLPGL